MALDINGYNNVFKSFVQFAQQRVDANDAKAVISATVTKPLQGRAILSLDTSKTDSVHKWMRTNDEYAVNDRTRTLFKAAIINMFGGANNDATRFVCQNFGVSCFNTVAGIPPAKRADVFKTFNLFCSLAGDAQEAKANPKDRYLLRGLRPMFLARVLRNLDGVLALDAKGQLNAKNLIKLCFPDMVKARATGNWDLAAVRDFLEGITDTIDVIAGNPRYRTVSGPMQEVMNQTGATLQEADDTLFNNKPIPMAPYVSAGQQDIQDYGTLAGGRAALAADLDRPSNYSVENGQQDILPPDAGFTFTFPGGESLLTNGTHKENIALVGDRVEALCGTRHPKQASSVMLMLSQGGLYEQLLNGSNDIRYDLQVSEDGTKATLTTSYFCKATMGAGAKPLDTFAPFTVQTRLTFDLAAEIPTIVDARFAQSLD